MRTGLFLLFIFSGLALAAQDETAQAVVYGLNKQVREVYQRKPAVNGYLVWHYMYNAVGQLKKLEKFEQGSIRRFTARDSMQWMSTVAFAYDGRGRKCSETLSDSSGKRCACVFFYNYEGICEIQKAIYQHDSVAQKIVYSYQRITTCDAPLLLKKQYLDPQNNLLYTAHIRYARNSREWNSVAGHQNSMYYWSYPECITLLDAKGDTLQDGFFKDGEALPHAGHVYRKQNESPDLHLIKRDCEDDLVTDACFYDEHYELFVDVALYDFCADNYYTEDMLTLKNVVLDSDCIVLRRSALFR